MFTKDTTRNRAMHTPNRIIRATRLDFSHPTHWVSFAGLGWIGGGNHIIASPQKV
jgi:hypothetical protein